MEGYRTAAVAAKQPRDEMTFEVLRAGRVIELKGRVA
jgi:hypothetical protein